MATVCVWYPHRGSAGGIDVGHSSLLLDRTSRPVYISWWPDGGVNKTRPSTKGHVVPRYRQDVEAELGNPSRMVWLKCLDEGVIATWWEQVQRRGFASPFMQPWQPVSNNYNLFDNNCSTIVLLAMKVGGAERIAPFQAGIVTPEHILFYALRLHRSQA